MVAPTLMADPEDIEYFVESLDATLAKGMPRLLAAFVKEKVGSRW
jgi:putrescine aminotransferase